MEVKARAAGDEAMHEQSARVDGRGCEVGMKPLPSTSGGLAALGRRRSLETATPLTQGRVATLIWIGSNAQIWKAFEIDSS